MTILLIRHGKTLANEKQLYCGSTDLSLSALGRAELMEKQPEAPQNCRYISSGMARANETLELLFGAVPYEVSPGFREVDFGKFELGSYEQLKNAPDYLAWITGDNMANTPPGGESGSAMTKRVLSAFEKVADDGQNAVIVTHGGVIAAIMEHLFPEEQKNRYQWQSANGSGYRLTFQQSSWRWQPL